MDHSIKQALVLLGKEITSGFPWSLKSIRENKPDKLIVRPSAGQDSVGQIASAVGLKDRSSDLFNGNVFDRCFHWINPWMIFYHVAISEDIKFALLVSQSHFRDVYELVWPMRQATGLSRKTAVLELEEREVRVIHQCAGDVNQFFETSLSNSDLSE